MIGSQVIAVGYHKGSDLQTELRIPGTLLHHAVTGRTCRYFPRARPGMGP